METDREILSAVKKRERRGRLLYRAGFTQACWDKVAAAYGVADDLYAFGKEAGFFMPVNLNPPLKKDAPVLDFSRYFRDVQIPDGVQISDAGELDLPGSIYHYTHKISPLRDIYDPDELKKFPLHRTKERHDFHALKENIRTAREGGETVTVWCGRLFEAAWPLRGYENMLADMLAEPQIAEYFLDAELDFNIATATAAAEAGADMICVGDDIGNQNCLTVSAELWRRMLKPRWAKIFAAARAVKPDIVVWFHSCGCIREIIPDLIEIGLDILNPIQPECMDIWEIHRQFKDVLSFDGGLGTQKVMPFGTPKDVEAAVKKLAETFGANGGLILAPSHVLEPEVPVDNVKAFIDAAQKYCR